MYIYIMEIEHKIRLIGNSFVITIPKQVVNGMGVNEGDMMLIDLKDDHIIIRKKSST